jgi:hypothetical protein
MKNIKLIFLIIIVFTISCKDKTPSKALTKVEMVSRTWVCQKADITSPSLTPIYVKGASGNLLELKDSFVTFFANGSYQGIDFNSTPQKGSWSFNKEETIAELADWDYEFNIVNLTEKNLDFNTKVDYNGKTYDVFVKMIPK